jgi:hypothetical protein
MSILRQTSTFKSGTKKIVVEIEERLGHKLKARGLFNLVVR